MPTPVVVPRLGWTMEEGTFVEWLKADGDAVRPGEFVFRLEGEKAAEEIESLDGGVLHIPADGPKPGDRVAVGTVIGFLLKPGETMPDAHTPASRERQRPEVLEPPAQTLRSLTLPARRASSPRARRLADRHNLDLTQLRGSGRNGRVRERDVIAVLGTTTVPHSPIRKAIAARMAESARTTAPVTLTTTVDATNLVALREQFKAQPGPPSYTDLLVKLTAHALQQHPILASRWAEDALHPAGRIDIGIAVDADAGLFVPVVRDVPALDLWALAAQTRILIDQARAGRLAARDLEGGCFTVTNLGAYGIDAFTPIINPPQCAVLGVGRIAKRPAVVGDAVVPREQVTLSLTFDHRVVDGGPAARFLQTLARMIEDPTPWVSCGSVTP